MSTSAATKAQSWPGSSSQLASAAGTNVNVGAGVSLVSGTLDSPAALSIAQTGHGFAVGDAVYFNGTLWAKAQANAAATLGLALVASVPNANAFVAQFSGTISVPSASFTSGQYYFVSDASAGALTATAPTSSTSYSNPLLFATSSTTGIVLPFRPSALGPAIVWPGSSSQLTSGSGTAVSLGTGVAINGTTLTTAGYRLAVDADTMLAYYFNETSGTTIANYGNATGNNLTAAGTYVLGDTGLFSRGTANILWTATAATDGANSASVSVPMPNTAGTLECVIQPFLQPAGQTNGTQICAAYNGASPTRGLLIQQATTVGPVTNEISANVWTASGTVAKAAVAYTDSLVGRRMHVAAVYTGSTIELWIDGSKVASNSAASVTLGTLTIMNAGGSGAVQAWRGRMAEVRLSRIARNQSYLLAATTAADAL